MAILILVIFAFGILEKCNKWVEASTMAILKSIPRVAAWASAAAMAMRAAARVSWGCAWMREGMLDCCRFIVRARRRGRGAGMRFSF